jgi:PKD repeat protein
MENGFGRMIGLSRSADAIGWQARFLPSESSNSNRGTSMHTWLRALFLSFVVALSACGGGGSSSPPKTPPTANFAFSCVDLTCNFVNTSTSQDTTDTLIAYTWTFGDGSPTASTVDAAHTYAAASTYTVSMLVIDSQGLRSTATRTITVTAPSAVAGPHASFTVSCIALDCTFNDTSTYDAGSVPHSRLWDFGDTVTLAATTNPATHSYPPTPQPTTYSARLTVTDAAGNSSTNVQNIIVAPPATTASCVSANCSLVLAQAARVTVTLVSHSCLAKNDTVQVTAPLMQTLFANGCVDTTGVPVSIGGGTLFPAGTALQLSVLSGTLTTTTIAFPPTIRLSGDFTQGWTLTFDDGYGGPAEPDFNDLVLLIKATP